ncbi:hypothetical protein DPEC_G00328810 [Dallia pectoralis]|uniref:Uncharacterized protein n=1 Tax=Dallia pectoralis TaxID=75939 RepID=A0ACC2F8I7_DALPE|nr:hypothetical protein DPEC_G00328810 [Dallia pectoralis]
MATLDPSPSPRRPHRSRACDEEPAAGVWEPYGMDEVRRMARRCPPAVACYSRVAAFMTNRRVGVFEEVLVIRLDSQTMCWGPGLGSEWAE